ncbi:MAG TPA: hypothetical protein ENI20_20435 [Bacteroides sp.]|nr:hypothetical protein [Bacteroides sp.]
MNFNDLEAGQSEIRNRILAPVFKRMGIIEQWGNGLQLIANELKNYPNLSEFQSGQLKRIGPDKGGYWEVVGK